MFCLISASMTDCLRKSYSKGKIFFRTTAAKTAPSKVAKLIFCKLIEKNYFF